MSASTLLMSSSPSGAELFPERLNIIYDSKCSVCQWEVDNLTYLMSKLPGADKEPKLIRFTDLESDDGGFLSGGETGQWEWGAVE